ncbi:hypothetical protein ACFSKL_00945 [Belliella marina]|uniref:Uncharacterized protein n=1 Tax=Belliella marina TaxID=1644146 RepID=A0ABW4VFF1_9BACT
MKKSVWLIASVLFFSLSCTEFEEVGGSCTVYLKDTDAGGTQSSYVIEQDLRRNKKTGVFTYRIFDEDGSSKLWSISRAKDPEEDGTYRYFSKSQDGRTIEVDRIECGNQIYLHKDVDEED